MSARPPELKEWIQCMKGALDELATASLRFDESGPASPRAPADGGRAGTYIAVLGDSCSMHLGLSADMEGCRVLARALLGLRRDESLSDKEAADAVCELMNILAGKVKSRMAGRDGEPRLGLPMFITSEIHVTVGMERWVEEVRVGPVACQLLVFRQRRAAAA